MTQLTEATRTTPTPHEQSAPPLLGDVTSFPSYAELTRTLIDPGSIAALATVTNDAFPYTSMAPVSADRDGAPIICISELAEHTRNLRRSARASVLIANPPIDDVDPLSTPRATFVGTFAPFEPDPSTIDRHLSAHPSTASYLGFDDFGWWRMSVHHLRYVGGFGVMGWASADDLAAAPPDPIIPAATPMIEHLNDDHADALALLARGADGASATTAATITDLDRHGLTLLATGPFDVHDHAVVRVAFPTALDEPDQVRPAVIRLVQLARDERPTSS